MLLDCKRLFDIIFREECWILLLELLQIMGMALNGILKKGEREEAERRLAELNDEKFKKIFGLLYKLNEKVDLFAKYNVDELFECRILSIDENYRGKGLAGILMIDTIKTAKDAGFKVSLIYF